MGNDSDLIRTYDGFRFLIPLAKAVEDETGLYLEGVASGTRKDSHGEVISAEGQASMARWANTGEVVLGGEADHFHVAFDDDLGNVVEGRVTETNEFYIRAKLDGDNPRAVHLHKKVREGTQLGLSVFGKITKSHTEESGTPVIDGVKLDRIMVTRKPAYPDTWLAAMAKSMAARPRNPDPVTDNVSSQSTAWTLSKQDLDDILQEKPPEAWDIEAMLAKAITSVDSWDGSASRWDTAQSYCSACLIDVNSAAGNDEKDKAHCKLPVKAPGGDAFVKQAIYAAAGGRGITQISKPSDVSEAAWNKAVTAAAKKLVRLYREMDEYAPEAVYELAGMERPDAAKEGGDQNSMSDAYTLAKAAFRDALEAYEAERERMQPVISEIARVREITDLVMMLNEVAGNLTWGRDMEPSEVARAIADSISEFKETVMGKTEDAGRDPQEEELETVAAEEADTEETVAKDGAEDDSSDPVGPSPATPQEDGEGLPEMYSTKDIAKRILEDEQGATPDVLPADTPVWAQALIDRVVALEQRLTSDPSTPLEGQDNVANQQTGEAVTEEETPEQLRKSQPPPIRASRNVAKDDQWHKVVDILMGM